jgi:SAM-dependent methyltransferase
MTALPSGTTVSSGTIALRTRDGRDMAPEADRWSIPASDVDRRVLARVHGPVLDVGCGPGRHLAALHAAGVTALGIDLSPAAVAHARRSGARVHEGCVFDAVPLEGSWRTVLLFDGNIGIGGEPTALLARCRDLLDPTGQVIAEVAAPGTPATRQDVRLVVDGTPGPWFPFATVPAFDACRRAAAAGLAVVEAWHDGDRHFVRLRPTP